MPPTLKDLATCIPGSTIVFGGDSVIRYMVTTLGLEAWGCVENGGSKSDVERSPLHENTCNMLFGLKERKGDGIVGTPPEWGPHINLTLHFRYLRFGYEFLDRVGSWMPDHMGDPGGADAILLGGMGYWDARYRTHDVLYNVLERLGEDMAPTLQRNPDLVSKLVVLSTTYSENFDGRMGMFPHDILDAVNAAAQPVWEGMGVPWFDVTPYVRTVGKGASSDDLAGRMAYGGGKLLTQDGYHPRVEVQRVILTQVFSHWCAAAKKRKLGVTPDRKARVPAVALSSTAVAVPVSTVAEAESEETARGINNASALVLLCMTLCSCTSRGRRLRRKALSCCCH